MVTIMGKLLKDFDDPIAIRNNRKPVWVNRHLVADLNRLAKSKNKDPLQIAEYILSVGINGSRQSKENNIIFDIDNL